MKAIHKCQILNCNKQFTSSFSLKRHMLLHSDVKEFKCQYCGKPFALFQYLKEHTYTHTGERPYICGINGCALAFRQACKLCVHRKSHCATLKGCGKRERADMADFSGFYQSVLVHYLESPFCIEFFDFSLYFKKISENAEKTREDGIENVMNDTLALDTINNANHARLEK